MTHTTTAADFEAFEAVGRRWLRLIGLMDWEVQFDHEPVHGQRSQIQYDPDSRTARLILSKTWGETMISAEAVAISAVHEVLHLAIGDLSSCGLRRFGNAYDMERLEEVLVIRLTKVLEPLIRAELPARVPRRRPLKANGAGEAVETSA